MLSVDPAISAYNGAGWAVFVEGELLCFGECSPLKRGTRADNRHIMPVARAIRDQVLSALHPYTGPRALDRATRVTDVVIEYPAHWGSSGHSGSVMPFGGIAGALAAWFDPATPRFPTVNEWRRGAGIKKDIQRNRTESRLRDSERALLKTRKASHNVWDAVGIGLWALER